MLIMHLYYVSGSYAQNVCVCVWTLMTGPDANATTTEIFPPSSQLQENKKRRTPPQFHLSTSSLTWRCIGRVCHGDYFPSLSLFPFSLFSLSLSSSHLMLLLRAVESDWHLLLRIEWLMELARRASHSYHGN